MLEAEAELIVYHRTYVESDRPSHTDGECPFSQRMITVTVDRQSRIKRTAQKSAGKPFFKLSRLTKTHFKRLFKTAV